MLLITITGTQRNVFMAEQRQADKIGETQVDITVINYRVIYERQHQ